MKVLNLSMLKADAAGQVEHGLVHVVAVRIEDQVGAEVFAEAALLVTAGGGDHVAAVRFRELDGAHVVLRDPDLGVVAPLGHQLPGECGDRRQGIVVDLAPRDLGTPLVQELDQGVGDVGAGLLLAPGGLFTMVFDFDHQRSFAHGDADDGARQVRDAGRFGEGQRT